MNKRIAICVILALVSLGLAVAGYFILPEQVVIQFSAGASGNSTAPKLLALLIPTALGVGGAVASWFTRDDGRALKKSLLVSVIGIALGIFMIVVNSFMQ